MGFMFWNVGVLGLRVLSRFWVLGLRVLESTRSRSLALSPAMFPSAHTACTAVSCERGIHVGVMVSAHGKMLLGC